MIISRHGRDLLFALVGWVFDVSMVAGMSASKRDSSKCSCGSSIQPLSGEGGGDSGMLSMLVCVVVFGCILVKSTPWEVEG